MEEIVKTRLPLLAWRWQGGRYRLIHDDQPIGDLAINAQGMALARYHDARWTIDPLNAHTTVLHQAGSRRRIGKVELHPASTLETHMEGPEQGYIELSERTYRCLRNRDKLPPQFTITRMQDQPLLQFRQEDQDHGRIQIDDQTAAGSSDFEVLVLIGLYLYLRGTSNFHTTTLERPRALVRQRHSRALVATGPGAPPPPHHPPRPKRTGGNGGGGSSQLWLTLLAGLMVSISVWGLLRVLQPVSLTEDRVSD